MIETRNFDFFLIFIYCIFARCKWKRLRAENACNPKEVKKNIFSVASLRKNTQVKNMKVISAKVFLIPIKNFNENSIVKHIRRVYGYKNESTKIRFSFIVIMKMLWNDCRKANFMSELLLLMIALFNFCIWFEIKLLAKFLNLCQNQFYFWNVKNRKLDWYPAVNPVPR